VAARELEPRAETGAIFGTSFGKTQHAGACCRAEVPECRPARTSRQAARPDARHHALQWLCEPTQAFVVAHGGNVVRNIEGTARIRSIMAGAESAPMKPGTTEPFGRLGLNGRPGPSRLCMMELHGPGSSCRCPRGRKTRQIVVAGGFPAPLQASAQPAIWSFASPKGFVIRSPLANLCFACSSVAQR
jgi:hypothetical protein